MGIKEMNNEEGNQQLFADQTIFGMKQSTKSSGGAHHVENSLNSGKNIGMEGIRDTPISINDGGVLKLRDEEANSTQDSATPRCPQYVETSQKASKAFCMGKIRDTLMMNICGEKLNMMEDTAEPRKDTWIAKGIINAWRAMRNMGDRKLNLLWVLIAQLSEVLAVSGRNKHEGWEGRRLQAIFRCYLGERDEVLTMLKRWRPSRYIRKEKENQVMGP
jgi:hypothetical protein